jgi:hypothetical protein
MWKSRAEVYMSRNLDLESGLAHTSPSNHVLACIGRKENHSLKKRVLRCTPWAPEHEILWNVVELRWSVRYTGLGLKLGNAHAEWGFLQS